VNFRVTSLLSSHFSALSQLLRIRFHGLLRTVLPKSEYIHSNKCVFSLTHLVSLPMPAPTNHTRDQLHNHQQTCRRHPGVPAENSDAVSRARHPYLMSFPSHCDPVLSRRLELGSDSCSMGSSPRWWWASPPPPWGRGGTAGKWWGLGGSAAVKASACLLLAGIAFRMLCRFSPSPWPEVSKGSGFNFNFLCCFQVLFLWCGNIGFN
jgi:hypothetical protein